VKVGIYTLGCKVNTYESEYVTKLLIEAGYKISNFEDICDIYIINTCTVTNTSDIKSRKIIRQARRRNPNSCVVAMGCFIQKLDNIMDEIDIAIGNKDKSKIIELLKEYFEKNKKINNLIKKEELTKFEDMYLDKYLNRTRAFVKIQDGCENFCSYCIIPFVRGKCRSKDFNKTIKEIETLVKNGFKEIVLTGIHTGNYGHDINTSFADLLEEIVKIKGLKRVRISSIEATELNSEVLKIIKNSDVIVDHLHIPIQAASNEVLKIMNRKYNIEEFISKINEIRDIRPNISITTDIIVGHPGETDTMFNNSIKTLKKINFSKLHVFPYSKRDGTKSATMEQIDEQTKKDRVHKLLALSKQLELNYMEKFINKELEVLFEVTHDNYSIGHTSNYLQIKVEGRHQSGEFKQIKLINIEYPYIIGKVIE